jgi:uncharacterized protein (DUF433 family)
MIPKRNAPPTTKKDTDTRLPKPSNGPPVVRPAARIPVSTPHFKTTARITVDEDINSGLPSVGQGEPVALTLVLEHLAAGHTPADVIQRFPNLTAVDIETAVQLAAYVLSERTLPWAVLVARFVANDHDDPNDIYLAAESALRPGWDTEDEDNAWKNL